MPDTSPPPPLGQPIPFEPPAADDLVVRGTTTDGQHVVIVPLTAGSAGVAHPSDSPQES